MSFEQFRTTIIQQDLARSNRYRVFIPGITTRTTEHLCAEVNLPSETIQSFEYAMPGIGPVTKVPNRILFENLSMSWMNLGNNEPYRSFREWMKDIYDSNYRFNDMHTYVKNVQVEELDRNNNMIGRHMFYEAYPQMVGPKSKTYAPSNTPEVFAVILNYETSELQ